MPESAPNLPPCSNCGDFRTVAITTGLWCSDGSRETTLVCCAAHQSTRVVEPVGGSVRATAIPGQEAR